MRVRSFTERGAIGRIYISAIADVIEAQHAQIAGLKRTVVFFAMSLLYKHQVLIDAPLNSLVHECSTEQQDSVGGGIGTVGWNLYVPGGGRGSAHLPEIFELLILWFHGFTDEDTQLLVIELMWRMRLTKKSLAKALPGVSDFPKLVTGIRSAEVKKVQNPNHRHCFQCADIRRIFLRESQMLRTVSMRLDRAYFPSGRRTSQDLLKKLQ